MRNVFWRSLTERIPAGSVIIMDDGPPKPVPPVDPHQPAGSADPISVLQQLNYRFDDADYRAALTQYEALYNEWRPYEDGPIRLIMAAQDANEALAHDARAVSEGRQMTTRYYRF